MKISGNIKFNYINEKDAKLVFECLEVDNEDYLESDLSDTQISYRIMSENLGSFLATADDLIASEIVSEKIIKSTQNK